MNKTKLKITTQLIVDEAIARGLSVDILDARKCFIRITTGSGRAYYLRSNSTEKSSTAGYLIANYKPVVDRVAADLGVKTPATIIYSDTESAAEFLVQHKSVVVKPADAAHGNGVTTGIRDKLSLESALGFAGRYSKTILLQEHVTGDDFRLLYIGGKLSAAAKRVPANVVGDGSHTVQELIDMENSNPDRGRNYQKKLNFIDSSAAKRYLGERISEVPSEGQVIQVVGTANIGAGGKSVDVTEEVPAALVDTGLKMVEGLNMGLCAVDILAVEGEPETARLIEINASPTFGMHEFPSEGSARPVTRDFLDWLLN